MKIKIGLADDHQLYTKSMSLLINSFGSFEVIVDALNGSQLIANLASAETEPDIILLDVHMPVMDGATAAQTLSEKYPLMKIVALSSAEDDTTVISMIRAGCCAYLLKDMHPDELDRALMEVFTKGYYNADASNINYRRLIRLANKEPEITLNDREKTFLQLACSDKTYKQIASDMGLAERTIDGYREILFDKFNVQSRVGMALEAVRRKYVVL